MKYLQGLTVLILGLGESGLAMARWCARCGAQQIRVWDSREQPPKLAELREALPQASFHTGAIDVAALLDGVRVVLKSPGLAPRDERIAPLLNQAMDQGALVQGELDLFNRALADLKAERGYAPKVLAITGTNGKTTTTSLAALLVERAGRRVAMAGNIGPTMLDTLAAALDLTPWPRRCRAMRRWTMRRSPTPTRSPRPRCCPPTATRTSPRRSRRPRMRRTSPTPTPSPQRRWSPPKKRRRCSWPRRRRRRRCSSTCPRCGCWSCRASSSTR
jgi:UDP-N-acetylmuramoylalanine--D-glutamate ligase